jgi:hypothetical protein
MYLSLSKYQIRVDIVIPVKEGIQAVILSAAKNLGARFLPAKGVFCNNFDHFSSKDLTTPDCLI